MKNKSINQKNIFASEEEKTLDWSILQNELKKNFGAEIDSSWHKRITLVKEYNDYLILYSYVFKKKNCINNSCLYIHWFS